MMTMTRDDLKTFKAWLESDEYVCPDGWIQVYVEDFYIDALKRDLKDVMAELVQELLDGPMGSWKD
jgi:hypothetical protein